MEFFFFLSAAKYNHMSRFRYFKPELIKAKLHSKTSDSFSIIYIWIMYRFFPVYGEELPHIARCIQYLIHYTTTTERIHILDRPNYTRITTNFNSLP